MKGLSLHWYRTYQEPMGNLSSFHASGCNFLQMIAPIPNLTGVPLDGKQTQDYPEKGDLGDCRCHSQKGEVAVLADNRTAQLSLLNAERSTDSLSRCVKFDQLATFTFEQMETKRQAEGVKMEPETRLSMSASVTLHSRG